ncbi:MAG: sulfurtransferase-like selenium metabolism protein YedF [Clostridiales bacterium]|nr:sulfurtransferase-like selenium metabolism protein YedF [Clostridiales bacterium]
MEKLIDARGMECPMPVVITKKALTDLDSGKVVALVDNEEAKDNILRLADNLKLSATVRRQAGEFSVEISKPSQEKRPFPALETSAASIAADWVLLVTGETIGRGSEELGGVLLKTFFYALLSAEFPPAVIIFMNGGVKLTCQGSPVLEHILALQAKGSRVLSCGACLDYFKLKTRLCAGAVSNMYDIAQTMAQTPKLVTL